MVIVVIMDTVTFDKGFLFGFFIADSHLNLSTCHRKQKSSTRQLGVVRNL